VRECFSLIVDCSGGYQCGSGECLEADTKCDNLFQCMDESDEQDCDRKFKFCFVYCSTRDNQELCIFSCS